MVKRALMIALSNRCVVMALLLAHALCMQDGKDALTLASMNGHTSVIQALRTAGAT